MTNSRNFMIQTAMSEQVRPFFISPLRYLDWVWRFVGFDLMTHRKLAIAHTRFLASILLFEIELIPYRQ